MLAALNTGFHPNRGDRAGHPDVMLVLTDGQDGSDVRSLLLPPMSPYPGMGGGLIVEGAPRLLRAERV